MGVKTKITLKELNQIFSSYNFTKIEPTSDGIVDTTYILSTKDKEYILKKYERDISQKVELDAKLLRDLKSASLNVPICLDAKDGWYIYEKLQGQTPKNISTFHIQSLARFLSSLHRHTHKKEFPTSFLQGYDLRKILNYIKSNHYAYYKKLQHLRGLKMQNDGLIHGDIFKDNTVFNGYKIGVFDFIDAGYGSFVFDAGVALLGFNVKKNHNYRINLFLKTYNQKAPNKLNKKELVDAIAIAEKFYALLRINEYKNTKKAKELL